jgi:hypothetical protein
MNQQQQHQQQQQMQMQILNLSIEIPSQRDGGVRTSFYSCYHDNDDQDKEQEAPIFSFLRASKMPSGLERSDPLALPTQHTVSTIGSSIGGDDEDDYSDCWTTEDDISLFSINDEGLFGDGCVPDEIRDALLHDEEGTNKRNTTMSSYNDVIEVIETAIHVASSDDEEDDEEPYCHESQGQSSLYLDYDHTLDHHDSNHEPDQDRDSHHQEDSMTSLNDAFAKLNDCMHRTAQSRKLVRGLVESLESSSPGVGFPSATTTATITTSCSQQIANSQTMRWISSSGSICSSLGSRSSRGSRGKHSRGKRSFNKARRRRFKKDALSSSKTGVAVRTSNGSSSVL